MNHFGLGVLFAAAALSTAASAAPTASIQEWAATVGAAVKARWHWPLNYVPTASSCRTWMRVAPNGDVMELKVLDDACAQDFVLRDSLERAVLLAQPFPAPPDASITQHGVVMRFRVAP